MEWFGCLIADGEELTQQLLETLYKSQNPLINGIILLESESRFRLHPSAAGERLLIKFLYTKVHTFKDVRKAFDQAAESDLGSHGRLSGILAYGYHPGAYRYIKKVFADMQIWIVNGNGLLTPL